MTKQTEIINFKKGDILNVNITGESEVVEVISTMKIGLSKFDFIILKRNIGAPYNITVSRLLKSIIK